MIQPVVDKILGIPDTTQNEELVQGTLTLSGNYGGGATHGDILSFANLSSVKSRSIPLRVEIYEQPPAGTAPSFYTAIFCPGSNNSSGVVNFSLSGVEYTEGSAYAGALAAAVWKFRAWFTLGQ